MQRWPQPGERNARGRWENFQLDQSRTLRFAGKVPGRGPHLSPFNSIETCHQALFARSSHTQLSHTCDLKNTNQEGVAPCSSAALRAATSSS